MGRAPTGQRAVADPDTWRLLEAMLRISQMRGAQSGGGAIQVRQAELPRQVIAKVLNGKRSDLAARLRSELERQAGSKPLYDSTFLVQTHMRYATASLSLKHEAHPFRFVETKARGLRQVCRFQAGKLDCQARAVETALTHNGDMDGMRWRGRVLSFVELGCLFERILGTKNRWQGDSPVLAGAIELYLTQGMWLESLRLAFQLTVAPLPPDLGFIPAGLGPAERLLAVRELMARHPAPELAELERWAQAAQRVLVDLQGSLPESELSDHKSWRRFREELTAALKLTVDSEFETIPPERSQAFARAAVQAFFDNDLYIAIRKLEPALDGTFGCVITSTLEPGTFVAMSRGQPLSLGFNHDALRVAAVSERAALKVEHEPGSLAFRQRLDLDLCGGEIARVAIAGGDIALTLYGISDGRESTAAELVAQGRLVSIVDNAYISRLPSEANDRVSADFAALVPVLAKVRKGFRSPKGKNHQTASAFADAIFERQRPRLLLIGITNDLWLSEQFVQNLALIFPELEARAVSSNEVLANPGALHLTEDTLVLAVSQSGQDFPTLGALVSLTDRAPKRAREAFFVLTGEVDSLLGQAVGQSYAKDAAFCRRIFSNQTGFRPSEASIAPVNATHLTLLELALFLAQEALDTKRFLRPPLGFSLDSNDLKRLNARRDQAIFEQVPRIVASSSERDELAQTVARHARRWSRHLTETIVAFGLVVLVLELNLWLDLGILPSSLVSLIPAIPGQPPYVASVLDTLGAQANVVFYAFLGPLFVTLLRTLQGRARVHRQGVRDLLIGDIGYVHKIAWLLSKKFFSLSYGFASIKPYSANCQDELVMTHEPVRGTLMLLGIPDSRHPHLALGAQSALMAAKQFNFSRSLGGGGAEIITVSHAPPGLLGGVSEHIALPSVDVGPLSARGQALLEGMFDSWERLLAMQKFLDHVSRAVSGFAFLRYDRSRTKDQVFAPTTAAPVSAAAIYQLLSRTSERYESSDEVTLPFQVSRSEWRGSAPPVQTTLWRPDAILKELEGTNPELAGRVSRSTRTPEEPLQ